MATSDAVVKNAGPALGLGSFTKTSLLLSIVKSNALLNCPSTHFSTFTPAVDSRWSAYELVDFLETMDERQRNWVGRTRRSPSTNSLNSDLQQRLDIKFEVTCGKLFRFAASREGQRMFSKTEDSEYAQPAIPSIPVQVTLFNFLFWYFKSARSRLAIAMSMPT